MTMKILNKDMKGDNTVEKIVNVENRKWLPQNGEVGDE